MNILVCVNQSYTYYLSVMLRSLSASNLDEDITVYCIHSSLTSDDEHVLEIENLNSRLKFEFIKIDSSELNDAPTVKRYPKEIYYRIFAYKYLPKELERVLYLDGDIIIRKSLKSLYTSDFCGKLMLAATHIDEVMTTLNKLRLGVKHDGVYLNSGVVLMNLALMREKFSEKDIYEFINKKRYVMTLFDQDVIFGLYGDKIGLIDTYVYNLTERQLNIFNITHLNDKRDIKWVEKNCVIVHYIGDNKPWKKGYRGILKSYYDEFAFERGDVK